MCVLCVFVWGVSACLVCVVYVLCVCGEGVHAVCVWCVCVVCVCEGRVCMPCVCRCVGGGGGVQAVSVVCCVCV